MILYDTIRQQSQIILHNKWLNNNNMKKTKKNKDWTKIQFSFQFQAKKKPKNPKKRQLPGLARTIATDKKDVQSDNRQHKLVQV